MLQLNGQVDTVAVGLSRYRQRHSHRCSDADLGLISTALPISPTNRWTWLGRRLELFPIGCVVKFESNARPSTSSAMPLPSSIVFRMSIAESQVSARRCFGG
jgi:hypothetical protein